MKKRKSQKNRNVLIFRSATIQSFPLSIFCFEFYNIAYLGLLADRVYIIPGIGYCRTNKQRVT